MAESRDANDPRDTMRAMNKEARAEFERDQAKDTGGQAHASRSDREGVPAERRADEDTGATRSTREQSDEDALRVARGDPATGGGNDAAGAPRERGEPSGE